MLNKVDNIDQMSVAEIQQLLKELNDLQLQNADLRSSLDCHERLFEKSPISCLSLDKDGVIQRVNDAAIKLLGGSKQDIINTHLNTYLSPDYKTAFDDYLGILLS